MKTNTRQNKEWTHFKRLLELCAASCEWQRSFFDHPQEFLDAHDLRLDIPTALDAFRLMQVQDFDAAKKNPYLYEIGEALQYVHKMYTGAAMPERIADSNFRAWYRRQGNRCGFQSRVIRHKAGFIYIPVTFELSDGCSVGCPFCCLSAKPLASVFRHTQTNAGLWREVLRQTREQIGMIADTSICYFATEPFDNPDYEQFLKDFYQMFGRYPQTTTAAAARDSGRGKAFLQFLGEDVLRQAAVRFSVLSLEQLKQIHQAYTAEELEHVELLLNNLESVYVYSKSGRAAELSGTHTDKLFTDRVSCICTCGFVVNMAKKNIMLAAPHFPDAAHPLGMRVYAERGFENAQDYGGILQEMIQQWMPLSMPLDRPLYAAAGVTWQRRGYRLSVKGDGVQRVVSLSDQQYRWFQLILDKRLSFTQVCRMEQMTDFERQQFQRKLGVFYDAGCVEEINF